MKLTEISFRTWPDSHAVLTFERNQGPYLPDKEHTLDGVTLSVVTGVQYYQVTVTFNPDSVLPGNEIAWMMVQAQEWLVDDVRAGLLMFLEAARR